MPPIFRREGQGGFVATDDFIHYSSAPRLNTTPPTAPTSFSRGKLTTFGSDTSASHSSSNSSTSGTGSSISSSTRGIGFATTTSYLKGARVAPRQRHQQQKRGPGAAMAPDPRGQEDNGSVGSIIAGHRISLNVHYDNEEPQTAASPTESSGKGGEVTPVEERVASTGALPRDAVDKASTEDSTVSSLDSQQKITHIDEVATDEKGDAEGGSLESPVPSSSSLSETRPDTPETTSADSSPETPSTSTASSPAAPEMFKSPLKQTEYLNGPDQIIPTDTIKTWEPSGVTKLKIGDQGPSAHTPISVPTLLKKATQKYPNTNALCVKRGGEWKAITYNEYYEQVRTMAKAFIKLGLEPYHGVCILGFNSPEWFIGDLAAIFAGGFAAGIYTTNSPEACEHCARNCEAQIWLVEDQKQLEKVLKIKSRLPSLRTIIQYSGKPTVEGVISWESAMALGKHQPDTELEERLRRIAVNQCCTLIYTSGTTGPPKGVMLSHDNITWTAHANCINAEFHAGKEVIVSFLPLSHVAAQMADIYISMYAGATLYFAQPDALKGSLGQTLKEIRPTRFLGVPRVWEKIHEKMMEVGRKTTGVKKSIATWAKSVGIETNNRKQRQDFSKPFGYTIANAVVFKKIRGVLGLDRCELFLSGAAPIAPDIVQYFHSLDIPLTEIYGMSESTGPHTIGTEKAFKIGSAGRTVPGCYTKLDKPDKEGNGEVCMGGRHVAMGYLRMEEKTHEAIDDEGWLHSGDIGRLDSDGFLFITGRIKELIITAGGENVAPVLVEDNLKAELPCLSNSMLIGDKRKFLSVLLTLKTNMNLDTGDPLDTLAPACVEWCRSVGSSAKTIQDVLAGPDANVMRGIQEGIDRANKIAPSNAQRIQKWTVLPRDFSVPGGELGPTMKLKRPVVVQKYFETIERFYEG
ncbi:long-chain-fatty-acid--CoA ligase ACSBG2-like isoform X4 [Eriocheir sinensis]|uniref:long-chain-fatty-acid--CoA ligase ACSBG2-like isoform X4 n=1 Tax=Eriocheir sinensis TaxID=95602 RepID=UPI0021C6D2FE|nr:long-chain-fatty-acid--CoA ligase ACSBG2-like isoform X4 [Eriocheir sinensis]